MTDEPALARPRMSTGTDELDRQVLRDLDAGRLDALEALYDRYRAIAYAIALRITGDATLAEDVVQEAFLGVWRNADRYAEGRGSVKTWLLSIVHHRAIDVVRRRRPVAGLPGADQPVPTQLVAPDLWPEVAGRLDAHIVREAVATLSDVQRQAIELAYWSGLSQTEIADHVGAPLGTVKSRMRLGLVALRAALVSAMPEDVGEMRS